jgi:hypothetical protein
VLAVLLLLVLTFAARLGWDVLHRWWGGSAALAAHGARCCGRAAASPVRVAPSEVDIL